MPNEQFYQGAVNMLVFTLIAKSVNISHSFKFKYDFITPNTIHYKTIQSKFNLTILNG